ncbi:MAG: type II toxin-antitoxin system RelE/ParE family toxin [Spartobacteria bacterium]
MIVDFYCKETARLWQVGKSTKFSTIKKPALRKLQMLNQALNITDLRVPPGNRLESLKGNRAGQYSIRINDQWRICFRWTREGPSLVEIVDYH